MDDAIAWLLLPCAASTWALTGIVWFVQVIHYPLFAAVEPGRFPAYQRLNLRLTAFVTGPLMIVEALTSVGLVVRRPDSVAPWAAWLSLGLLAVIWLNTALQVVPDHVRLQGGFDEALHARLLARNLVRTLAWTARSALLVGLLRGGML